MAAEFSTLVSSFLDSKPEIYGSFFLDCVNSKQYLNTEKIPDGWVGKVNTFLNSKTDSWLGVCLLGITVEQCDSDMFTKNCASWMRTILQLIQTSGRSSVVKYCTKLMDDILRHAVKFSELSRELSNSVIPAIISAVLSNKCIDVSCSLSILLSCVRYFPGPSGPSRNQIENFLLPILNSTCEETRKSACECYAILPRCTRIGSGGKNQTCPWETQWNRMLNTIHKLLDAAYENIEPVSSRTSQDSSSDPETLPLGEIPQIEPGRTYTLVTRCNTLLHCLSAMIREDYHKVVTVPIDASIALLTRILSITSNSLKNAVIVESVLLRASLPLIHESTIALLTTLIMRCGSLMLPYCDLLMKLLAQELTWTKCQDPIYGYDKPYRHLRCSVYLCLEHWVQMTNSLPDGGEVVAKLMQNVLDDIKPLILQTKLLPSTNAGNSQMSKKAKKRKLQDDVDLLLTGQQKFDRRANEMVTYRALRALSAVLTSVGSDIPQDVQREIQVCIIELIIQCQQSPYQSYPIPYSSADCRQALYHSLVSCLLTNSPHVPSPVHHAVRLFSGGLQDGDFKVSSVCREALAVTNSIIHPRSFPRVCSALGPLFLSTSEGPSANGPVSGPHNQSVPESCSSSSLNINVNSQQSTEGRAFENGNSLSQLQDHENTMEYGEYQKTVESVDDVNTSFTDKHTEGSQTIGISDSHFKTSGNRESGSKLPENKKQQSETGNVAMENTNSQSSGVQLSASSSNTSTAHLLNREGFIIANTIKKPSPSTTSATVNQRVGDLCTSIPQSAEEHNLDETVGTSVPKRRKTDDNSNLADKHMHKDNHGPPTTSKDHLAGNTDEKKAEVAVSADSDETSKMLATFVDSYPDSDDQEIV